MVHRRLALALVLACSACTSGTTRTSRRAWDNALKKPGDTASAVGGGSQSGPRRQDSDRDTWQALSHFTDDAIEILADGSTTVSMQKLASQLCAETPEALTETPDIEALRCAPRLALAPLGHDLELELGKASTIALFAADLTDQASEELVRQTLRQLTGACREAWAPMPSRADNAHEDFHTCPTGTGAVLVLGRFPSNLGAGTWQFSLAVLGPG